jgi:phosphoribosylformylglycinamidine synthase
MNQEVRRLFVEKKYGFDIEAQRLLKDLREDLFIYSLKNLRIINCYHISGVSDQEYNMSKNLIFSEVTVDNIYDELPMNSDEIAFAVEYLPGQYDMRADSASECIQLLTQKSRPLVHNSKVFILEGRISEEELNKIKNYCINPVDSRETSLNKMDKLFMDVVEPGDIKAIDKFIDLDKEGLDALRKELGLAMSIDDILFCQNYFKNEEKRNPSITEIRVIDTYWSDHCRHTTFLTRITDVKIERNKFTEPIIESYEEYLSLRADLYKTKERPVTLMDIATIAVRKLKKEGLLNDLDESDEINACSIKVNVDVDGKLEPWLVMFKNETHNHPTEIEPFGGAATCLGGAIRDPLSGRTYVYQAMRVTGSADPRKSIEDTLQGKLPQRKITTGAAHGYSSYGNQIGLATGHVEEIYHPGYEAKRMEVGAVIAAAPEKNVVRIAPVAGDIIVLLGGRTGRDGCGGATGSSKEHTEDSILTCGAEVQKGNAPTERKIQRLFRNEKVSTLIKKCNDFGAGGVAVAIGELADGLNINLDLVLKKYEGLDGTELAISESQERMAVVIEKENVDLFINYAKEENLEAVVVAEVTDSNRLTMKWRDGNIVDLCRDFLNTNGAPSYSEVYIKSPESKDFFDKFEESCDLKEKWMETLTELNVCSQKGLVERFDSTIGSGTVTMPFGGKYQDTPAEAMAAKIPVLHGETNTATIMSHGFNPYLSSWSPYHGAMFSIVEAVSKVVAMGGDYKGIRLSLQEYFERLGSDTTRWGKPFAALLGALKAQMEFGIGAIGGKDSMSGSFKDMDVPPTVVTFAVNVVDSTDRIITPEFKGIDSRVVLIKTAFDDKKIPNFAQMRNNFERVTTLVKENKIISASSVKQGGLCEAISKMTFGNKIGFATENTVDVNWFYPYYGSIILELNKDIDLSKELKDVDYVEIGRTTKEASIKVDNTEILIEDSLNKWIEPLEEIFPSKTKSRSENVQKEIAASKNNVNKVSIIYTKPKVFIPVFPGTNCEYDTAKAFEKAGATVNTFVFNNLTAESIPQSVERMIKEIEKAQIIALPGGFSAGDEPDGSGKFIATVFRNPAIKDAVMEFLKNRDGLMIGICNGFQALIKLGLVPYGEIRDLDSTSPTLTYNEIGRHASCIVNTKIVSKLSPWLNGVNVGDVHAVPISHGEGRFVGSREVIEELFQNGQIATQYVDMEGNVTMDMPYNPNGSYYGIEGITSPDGKVLGKMAHSERVGNGVHKNIYGEKDQKIFVSGVNYFK